MFFNSMNLDTKYGCGHFGSRFPLDCDSVFSISHPVFFPTLLALGSGIFDDYHKRYEMHWLVQVDLHRSTEVI